MEGILLADNGDVLEKQRLNTPKDDYQETLDRLSKIIHGLQHKAQDRGAANNVSVGIGTPGAIIPETGILKNCNSVNLNGKPLQRDLEKLLGYEVKIENDANCLVLSEAHFGAAKNARNVFGVIIGTGTGGGVVINKKLVNGPNSIGGEWGHNCVPASVVASLGKHYKPRTCYCGRQDCNEIYLSGRGLKLTHKALHSELLDAQAISEGAMQGNENCQRTIDLYCQHLAHCLSTMINVLDPDMVVFGGGLSNMQVIYDKVPKYLAPLVFTDDLKTAISPPGFGDASGALGAACLWN